MNTADTRPVEYQFRALVETHEALQTEYKARIAELEDENAKLREEWENCRELLDYALSEKDARPTYTTGGREKHAEAGELARAYAGKP